MAESGRATPVSVTVNRISNLDVIKKATRVIGVGRYLFLPGFNEAQVDVLSKLAPGRNLPLTYCGLRGR